jgi:hypothetical protein
VTATVLDTATARVSQGTSHAIRSGLVDQVAEVLREHHIGHGVLTEGPPHLNLNVTDHQAVFVKITRPGDPHERAHNECRSARWARVHGIRVGEPLLDEPALITGPDGTTQAVTVWRWAAPCTGPSLENRCLDVLGTVARLNTVPAPAWADPFPIPMYHRRVHTRLAGRADPVADLVRERIYDTYAAITTAQARTPRAWTTRWAHADLHLRNVIWGVHGQPVILDWESAALAPVEVDLAQILRSIWVYAPTYSAPERLRVASRVVAEADALMGVDWALVRHLMVFRAASSASHLLTHGHDPAVLAADLALLGSTLDWLPTD